MNRASGPTHPELEKALVAAKKHKATLILAKLDRLARNVAFIAGFMERNVEFVCCDVPNATPFMLHAYAALAEEERRMITARTKAGLAAPKAKGVKLGNARLAADNRADAVARANEIKPILRELRGLSAQATAVELNARAVPTPTGAPWSAKTVIRDARASRRRARAAARPAGGSTLLGRVTQGPDLTSGFALSTDAEWCCSAERIGRHDPKLPKTRRHQRLKSRTAAGLLPHGRCAILLAEHGGGPIAPHLRSRTIRSAS